MPLSDKALRGELRELAPGERIILDDLIEIAGEMGESEILADLRAIHASI